MNKSERQRILISLSRLAVKNLKQILGQRELSVSGNKQNQIDRTIDSCKAADQQLSLNDRKFGRTLNFTVSISD